MSCILPSAREPVNSCHLIGARSCRIICRLPPADERADPVKRALGDVGRAIGEGAERGDPLVRRRAGVRLCRIRKPVECVPRDPERQAERTIDA